MCSKAEKTAPAALYGARHRLAPAAGFAATILFAREKEPQILEFAPSSSSHIPESRCFGSILTLTHMQRDEA
jgi:hypothetical protein